MPVSQRELPSGVVTFLFTDIEGSTRLLRELGAERYAEELIRHREHVRAAAAAHAGVEIGTEGDAFFIAFERAEDGLAAAERMQQALAAGPIRVRMGVHTGEVLVADDDYVGLEVHKAARICSAAHGGQVLVSRRTCELAGAELRDLGEHRLKDLAAPERLYQIGDARFPPPRAIHRTNLPVQPLPLVGRSRELAELVELARTHRVVTLTGPGGTGKTRLALALGAELSEGNPDGVWWVPLAAVADPALVVPTIARVLDARADGLAEQLADKRLVLLLDNLEQVVDAAPAIGQLLEAVPGFSVVATSRERLALRAEHEYPVPPLSEPAAIEFFTSRARQVKPDFAPEPELAEICRRLDQLPLALELAATRVKLLSQPQILARLEDRLGLLTAGPRDLPERQATMRAAIAWSYDLLDEAERRAFRALGIFAGSFELDAAEAVCGAEVDDLQSLVDKSLLRRREDGRFFLLETTREYALEQLAGAGETDTVRERHAAWFLALAQAAGEGLRTASQREWFQRLRADNDNLRAVLAWALTADLARGVELTETLSLPWRMGGQVGELVTWYERAHARLDGLSPAERVAGLTTFGVALSFVEDYARAEQVLTESLALVRAAADEPGESSVLAKLGTVAVGVGATDEATRLYEQALAIAQRLGDPLAISRSLHLLAETLRDAGELDRAVPMLEQAAQIDTARGDQHAAMTSLHSLGDLVLDRGDPGTAAAHYREALAICIELDDDRSQAYCLAGLACVAAMNGDPAEAGRLWGAAEAVEARIGLRMLTFERARYEHVLASLEGEEAFAAGHAAGLAQPLDEAAAAALAG